MLQSSVNWLKTPQTRLPTQLMQLMLFASFSTQYANRFDGIVHMNGFVSWAASDVNTVHFVHTAWLRSPHHPVRTQPGAYGAYQWAYTRLNASWERWALRKTRVVVAVSERVKAELGTTLAVSTDRVRLIRNGVDLDEFRPRPVSRRDKGLPEAGFLVLFAGDLRLRRKNLDAVLRALVGLPDVHLAVAGDARRSPYPLLAGQLGVGERVHFLGHRSDMADLMAACDAVVFPSHYEPDGLVCREAMAAGRPVITATSVGGAEVIRNGQTGFVLADPSDDRSLAEYISWLQHHPEESSRLGRNARIVAADYSWSRMADSYVRLYQEFC